MDADHAAAAAPPIDATQPRPRTASAFVMDPETRQALERGLPDWELDVRDGNIRTAAKVLAGAASPRLLLVDLDGVRYPAGSVHELAAVCAVDTVVVALGSDDSARFGRDLLTTGVADYLIKPVTPVRLQEVVTGAQSPPARGPDWQGLAVGFTGTCGSGATTLLAATAIAAAERGRYVSVLDLNRAFGGVPFLLDVEPEAGFDDLIETAAGGTVDPELVEAARVSHSDRISVYGYRWRPLLPPPAPVSGVRRLLSALRRRSHLVLVDPEPHGRAGVLRDCDVRVLVVEPTECGILRFVRARAGLDAGRATLQVHNHTRRTGRSEVANSLRAAASVDAPDVAFPFEADLPELSDWGHLADRLPRGFRKPLHALIDLLDAAPDARGSEAAATA